MDARTLVCAADHRRKTIEAGGSIILNAFREVHARIRAALEGVSDESLNRRPSADSNSIAVIITHLLGSERETLRAVGGLDVHRDRDAEFRVSGVSRDELVRLLEAADALIDEVTPLITPERLSVAVSLPTLAMRSVEPIGIERLIYNFGHAREHFGELSVTRNLLS